MDHSLHDFRFVSDCVILSLCSACGQLFIYETISEFGPVVFIIIMTVRQLLAVVLSCIFYKHALSALSVLGMFTTFSYNPFSPVAEPLDKGQIYFR
jgi:solute carrier family 35 (adenosine 3'-phospho 5'-phosphosulfate transporter), member B2